jgi:hypothetical protein
VPAEVTRRVELVVDDRADAGVVVAGSDHLVVAGARREVLARLADPGEAGDLVRVGVAVRAVDLAIRERGVLGPVAAVDVADDDVLARAAADAALVDAAELVPEPAGWSIPRNAGVDEVSSSKFWAFSTTSTPSASSSLAAWASVSLAAKPLKTAV